MHRSGNSGLNAGNEAAIQICHKCRRMGCVIPHCNLQYIITQPILQLISLHASTEAFVLFKFQTDDGFPDLFLVVPEPGDQLCRDVLDAVELLVGRPVALARAATALEEERLRQPFAALHQEFRIGSYYSLDKIGHQLGKGKPFWVLRLG